MAMAVPQKIVLKSTTSISLNDRFSSITSVHVAPSVDEMRTQMVANHQASVKNQRLAQQMANRPSVQAALASAQPQQVATVSQRVGNTNQPASVKTRLGVGGRITYLGAGGMRRGGFAVRGTGRPVVVYRSWRGGPGFGQQSAGQNRAQYVYRRAWGNVRGRGAMRFGANNAVYYSRGRGVFRGQGDFSRGGRGRGQWMAQRGGAMARGGAIYSRGGGSQAAVNRGGAGVNRGGFINRGGAGVNRGGAGVNRGGARVTRGRGGVNRGGGGVNRGAARGRGTGQQEVTRDQLDEQLDQYMSASRNADLDTYMRSTHY